MKYISRSIFLVLLSSWATGQPEKVSCQFSVVGWGKSISGLYYQTGENLEVMEEIPLFEKSKDYPYRGEGTIYFFDSSEKSSSARKPVAAAKIPTGSSHIMVLLAPKEDGYIAHSLRDDPSNIPIGKGMVINLTPHPLGMRLKDSEPVRIESGKQTLVHADAKKLVQMEMHYQVDEKWMKFTNVILPVRPTQQTLIIFLASDSAYFRSIDHQAAEPIQMIVLSNDHSSGEKAENAIIQGSGSAESTD